MRTRKEKLKPARCKTGGCVFRDAGNADQTPDIRHARRMDAGNRQTAQLDQKARIFGHKAPPGNADRNQEQGDEDQREPG